VHLVIHKCRNTGLEAAIPG